jgi:hypothetical protein
MMSIAFGILLSLELANVLAVLLWITALLMFGVDGVILWLFLRS